MLIYTQKQIDDMTHMTGRLDLHNIKDDIELPENLTINGDVQLYNSQITSLPNGLVVHGSLDITGTKIRALPDGLKVYGDLSITKTRMTFLPNDLYVSGTIRVGSAPVLSVPNIIYGSIEFGPYFNSTITIPKLFIVCRDLDISSTNIKITPMSKVIVGGTFAGNTANFTDIDHTTIYAKTIDNLSAFCDENQKLRKTIKALHDGLSDPNLYIYCNKKINFISHSQKMGKYTYYTGSPGFTNILFDGVHYIECTDIQAGLKESENRFMDDRGCKKYRYLRKTDIVQLVDLFTMYQTITGISRRKMNRSMKRLIEILTEPAYSIDEFIRMTRGMYNSEVFEKFFE